ncbi:MAG: hypothetical protein ACFCVK_16720 [Acidimicrobiales bacterium]
MTSRRVLVIGNSMVGQRLVERLVAADTSPSLAITVVGEEPRPAYDRVALSSWFQGRTEADLPSSTTPSSTATVSSTDWSGR